MSRRCRYFSRKISSGPIDALTEGVPHKPRDLNRRLSIGFRLLERLRHAPVGVMNERLIQQANFLVEGLKPGFDHLLDYMRRFSLPLGLIGQHFSFAPYQIRIKAGWIERLRIGGGNVHCDLTAETRERLACCSRLQPHNDADFTQTLIHRIMSVGRYHALAHRERCSPPQRHVLADLGNGVGDRLIHRKAADLCLLDLLDVRARAERDVCDHLHEPLKQLIARDEICLGIHFNHNALARFYRHSDQAFRRNAARFLRSLGKSFFAQQIDGLLHVAAGVAKGALAIHHAGAGALA